MEKYRIYIDEVGNSDLESSDNPNHRFLSLTGVIVNLKYVVNTLHPQIERLKSEFFGAHPDEPVIFHRKELLNGRFPFSCLKDNLIRENFDKKLLALLTNWQYSVISVCVDKLKHKETYTTWRYDPYHYCLEIMLERYIFFLDAINCVGDVMAESRGKPDRRLKKAFNELYKNGTDYIAPERMTQRLTSSQLKVKNKANNIAGLQLADLLAHPSRNEILRENGFIDKKPALFGSKITQILQDKYYCKGSRVFGKKMM